MLVGVGLDQARINSKAFTASGCIPLAASNIRPDGYHPEITAPEQDDPRLPTAEEFVTWQADYEAVAPNPADFFLFLERMQPVVHDFAGWTADEIRSITAPTFLVVGDRDFVRLDHAAEMLDLFPDCRLAVLPGNTAIEIGADVRVILLRSV